MINREIDELIAKAGLRSLPLMPDEVIVKPNPSEIIIRGQEFLDVCTVGEYNERVEIISHLEMKVFRDTDVDVFLVWKAIDADGSVGFYEFEPSYYNGRFSCSGAEIKGYYNAFENAARLKPGENHKALRRILDAVHKQR